VARHPHHVWGADLTLLPLAGGFAVPWWPFCCLPCWPFCWWVLLVVDHFSRAVVQVAVFAKQPSEAEVVAALEQAVQATGPPRHFITDRGAQFQGAFRAFCERHGIRQRYGAIGKYGSIAVVERVNRTLKHEGLRCWLLPFGKAAMLRELELWRRWYNEQRPYASHFGATPAEVLEGRLPACGEARFETRERGGGRVLLRARPAARLELDVSYSEGRPHLPVVSLRQAA
jgi:transposase InsO family protein